MNADSSQPVSKHGYTERPTPKPYEIWRDCYGHLCMVIGIGIWEDIVDKGSSLECVARPYVAYRHFRYGDGDQPKSRLVELTNTVHRLSFFSLVPLDDWYHTREVKGKIVPRFTRVPDSEL